MTVVFSRLTIPWSGLRRLLSVCLVAALCVFSVSCEQDTSKIEMALTALKDREDKLTSREAALQKQIEDLTQRERLLAETAAALQQQRNETEALKHQLNNKIAEVKARQESLLLRERRGPPPSVNAERVIVIDPRSGEVLLEKNADKRGQVASTQKLMTALVVAENGSLDQPVIVEQSDTECAPVRFGLKAGDRYSRRQLLTALMVKSSNDIAQALARDNAGSLPAFAKKMNARAASLGMKNSFFVNPNGLPEDAQYSTARDMAMVAKAVDNLPDVREMIRTKIYEFKKTDGSIVPLQNTNRVLRSYEPCDGMKTGYTQLAGYCLISSGEIEGRRRIVVVLNDTARSVWTDSQSLLEWALKG